MNLTLPAPQPPPGMPLRGRDAAVFGLGKSGVASARFLHAHGARVTAFDQGPADKLAEALTELEALGVRALAGVTDWAALGGADLLVVSPGVPVNHPFLQAARAAGVEVIGEIELAFRFCAAPLAAVAGTNGKGSTTTLLGAMLQRAGRRAVIGGNIGTPLVSVVEGDWEIVVAEVSSFQLETIVDFRPWATILLNITPDHLDRHPTFADYVAAKQRLFLNQTAAELAVLYQDDPAVWGLAGTVGATVLPVSLSDPGAVGVLDGDTLLACLPNRAPVVICRREDLVLQGPHYVTDALCAGVVAAAAGCSSEAMTAAVRSWGPAQHLLTEVAVVQGVRFVDDSKATNPGAAAADLDGIAGRLWVIAGGLNKGLDLSGFADKLARRAAGAFLIGQAAAEIADHLAGRIPVTHCPDIESAVRSAFGVAQPGDTVILAPACASFDQFRNQAERGDRFAAAARALPSV